MRLALSLVTLLLLSPSFGFRADFTGNYEGEGGWKTSSLTRGRWTSVIRITQTPKGFTLNEKLTIFDNKGNPDVEQTEWTVEGRGAGFFDVFDGGTKVGWGHCEENVCQIERKRRRAKDRYLETLWFEPGEMRKIGYDSPGNDVFAWKGRLLKKTAPPDSE